MAVKDIGRGGGRGRGPRPTEDAPSPADQPVERGIVLRLGGPARDRDEWRPGWGFGGPDDLGWAIQSGHGWRSRAATIAAAAPAAGRSKTDARSRASSGARSLGASPARAPSARSASRPTMTIRPPEFATAS